MSKKNRPSLTVRLAQNINDIKLAQALRAQSFGAEFGVDFATGLDADRFDAECKHVLVFDEGAVADYDQYDKHSLKPFEQHTSKLVATTRLMGRDGAYKLGQFYTQGEFELSQLLTEFEGEVLEIGRTCVHKNYRSMAAINALWQGIGEVAASTGAKALMGCASIPIDSGNTQHWLDSLDDDCKIPSFPKTALPSFKNSADLADTPTTIPPLLKAYLRMGSLVGDTACFDPAFNCADVLIWFPFERMDKRYLARFGNKIEV